MSDPEMTTFGMYPEPEPVAWLHMLTVDGELFPKPTLVPRSDQDIPLYTAQPRREWVGLTYLEKEVIIADCTDEELDSWVNVSAVADLIGAKLKEKNT